MWMSWVNTSTSRWHCHSLARFEHEYPNVAGGDGQQVVAAAQIGGKGDVVYSVTYTRHRVCLCPAPRILTENGGIGLLSK